MDKKKDRNCGSCTHWGAQFLDGVKLSRQRAYPCKWRPANVPQIPTAFQRRPYDPPIWPWERGQMTEARDGADCPCWKREAREMLT